MTIITKQQQSNVQKIITAVGVIAFLATAILATEQQQAQAMQVPLIQSTPQPMQQPQPTSMQQANNQSQPQWLWTAGGGNSYTLAYPSNWKVEETPRVTPFDKTETVFTTNNRDRLSISISPSDVTSMEDFKNYNSFMSRAVTTALPNAIVEGSGFGYYNLGGLETFGMLISMPSEIQGINKKALDLRTFINGWEIELIYAAPDFYFNSEMPIVQQMVDSFYLNA